MHRLVPSPVVTHAFEQHSLFSWQTSPTCRVHSFSSLPVHFASSAHRSTPVASVAQRVEQQSPAVVHVSPAGRHPWRSSQAPPSSSLSDRCTQTRPQHSVSVAQSSPAGRHPAPADVQTLPAHRFEQHS
jgi:hypothetical protein